ncbi:MAG: hypothetical protein KGZ90_15550 [Algoriphagus sp.]|nr:hypothetical protein [Algoriphagus sp.]
MDFYLRNDECEEAILVVVSEQSQWAASQKVEVRKLNVYSRLTSNHLEILM